MANKNIDEGLKILFDTYWKNGWKMNRNIKDEDFQIAKKEGIMFDYPKAKTHAETLKELDEVLKKISPLDVANAFLYSLSTRKLEYRSALSSYWYAIAIPKHKLDSKKSINGQHCYLCGWYQWNKNPSKHALTGGLNTFNFERYKFGGVRNTSLDYALFDLQQFLKLPKVTPTDEDKKILIQILECVNKLEPKDKAGKLREVISKAKIFKTNKNELSKVLDALGICGVLASKEAPCYVDCFVNEYERDPIEYNNDFKYPLNRWHKSDGINKEHFERTFFFKLPLSDK